MARKMPASEAPRSAPTLTRAGLPVAADPAPGGEAGAGAALSDALAAGGAGRAASEVDGDGEQANSSRRLSPTTTVARIAALLPTTDRTARSARAAEASLHARCARSAPAR